MNNRKLLAILLTILTVLIGVIFVLTLLLRFNNEQPISDNNDSLLGINQSKITLGGADPVTMDPHIAGDGSSATYIVEIFGGLVTITPDMEIVLDLAQSLEVSDDGLVYTFTLRDDIYFHSGRKVTANDVKWSLERAASPQLNSNTSLSYLRDIVGFIERRYGQADEISGVEVIDDKTISIEIDFPKSYFLAKLTYPTAFVIDKDQVELNPRNWTRKPNGTGPYKLSEWKLGERIILEANTRYHLGVGNVQVVDYQLSGGSILTRFENGEVDSAGISQNDIDRVRDPSEPLNKLYRQSNYFQTNYIGMNNAIAPFDDIFVRQAFASAIDIGKITDITYKKMLPQATGILPPGMYGYDESKKAYEYNPELAQELLAKSKYGSAENLPPIVFSDIGAGAEGSTDIQAYIEQWKKNLGVTVQLRQSDFATFLADLDSNKLQIYSIGWIMDYPDPENILDVKFHSQSTENNENYSNAVVDQLLENARSELDTDKRALLYQEAEEIIVKEAPWIPTYFTTSHYVISKKIKKWIEPAMIVPKLRFVEIAE
ncbi:MAG: ABC transporter substrate-binding protein [Dehalococcoidia bacterium]